MKRGTLLYIGPWHMVFQRPHHLMRAMMALGWTFELMVGETKRGRVEAEARQWPESAALPSRIHAFPRPFSNRNRLLRWINPLAVARRRAAWLRDHPPARPLVLFYGAPEHLGWIDRLAPDAVVFDVLDDYEDFPAVRGTPRALEVRADFQKLVERADLVPVTSRPLLEKVARHTTRHLLLPNGCEPGHFGRARTATPGRRVIYYGALESWVDRELLVAVAGRLPDVVFDLYGPPGPVLSEPLPSNVVWHGPSPYAELPERLAGAAAAIIPFRTGSPLIQATNPIKFYEYQAAGLPVVATPMPELEPFAHPDHLVLADGAGAFAGALARFLAEEADPAVRGPRMEARKALARAQSWEARAAVLDQALQRLLEP